MKLAQAGFEDFLADTCVRKLKGDVTIIKRCNFVDKISGSAGQKKLIVN